MNRIYLLAVFILLLFAGCASFQAAGETQRGRYQLLFGDPNVALAHFQRAAEIDPNFVMGHAGVFQEGVWTYVGRANYATGKLPEARQALESALSRDQDDNLAKLYLGLVLARDGDRQRGVREIENGMRGIHDWLEHIHWYTWYGKFWDPRGEIRSEIKTELAMISGKDVDLQKLIAGGEWVGKKVEDEIDRAKRDEREELTTQMGDGRP